MRNILRENGNVNDNFLSLGDYFGLLMSKRATNFPFNIMNNPMYWGSSMNFLGYSLRWDFFKNCFVCAHFVYICELILLFRCPQAAVVFRGPHEKKKKRRERKKKKYILWKIPMKGCIPFFHFLNYYWGIKDQHMFNCIYCSF